MIVFGVKNKSVVKLMEGIVDEVKVGIFFF